MEERGWYKSGEALLDEMRKTRVPQDMLALWYLGQAGIAVKYGEHVLAVDPYLGRPEPDTRSFPPPFAPEEADFLDVVLCTHNHSDHLDPYTLRGIAQSFEKTVFVVPRPCVQVVLDCGIEKERVIGAAAGEEIWLGEVTICPVPAAHEELFCDENGDYENLGYVMKFPEAVVYHSGDTIEWESMTEELRPFGIDVACLPINGSDWKRKRADIIGNLNSREAADVADEIGADLLIPMHFDLFPHNGENPAHLVDYMFTEHFGHKYHVMALGERFFYSR